MTHLPLAAVNRALDALRRLVGSRSGPATATEPLRTDGGTSGEDSEDVEEHLREVPDGAGCTEIWEHLSERAADVDD